MTPTRSRILLGLALAAPLFTAGSLLGASEAAAMECAADADCGTGFHCELAPSTPVPQPDCAPNTDCPQPGTETGAGTPAPSAAGWCVATPLSCKADADCPDYMACEKQGYGCTASACAPNEACPEPAPCEPPPDLPSYCAPRQINCETDAPCPDGFACTGQMSEVGCAAPSCQEGADCPPVECTPGPTQKFCAPKEIDCGSDAMCPATWTCMAMVTGECSSTVGSGTGSTGSGSTGSMGTGSGGAASTPPAPGTGAPTPAPTPPSDPPNGGQPGDGCVTQTVHRCAPPGYATYGSSGGPLGAPEAASDGKGAGAAGSTQGGASNGAPGSAGSQSGNGYYAAPADEGCSVGAVGATGTRPAGRASSLALLALGLAAGLSRLAPRRAGRQPRR
jgi:hypothetical protein